MWKKSLSVAKYILPLLIVAILLVTISQPAYAVLGWVGNMFPAGGSTTTLTTPASFDVYVSVYKFGVTDSGGQGAGITCTLRWAPVGYFGGAWGAATDTPMNYISDDVNNDRYKGTITPGVGLYEFTAICSDGTPDEQDDGYGKLLVDTASGSCNSATQGDNNVYYNGLGHNSFDTTYRSVFGAVPTNQGTVTLKLRTCMDDVDAVPQVRVYDDRTNTESLLNMDFDSHASDASLGGVTLWTKTISIPATPDILYYRFKATNGAATAYYRDDDPKFYGGGWGAGESDLTTANNNSYQITVYDQNFTTPSWLKNAVIYQIYPERFRNGDTGNDPTNGGDWIYAQTVRKLSWNQDLCDPRGGLCPNEYGNQFYGGDLQGVIDELDYLKAQGVTVIYFNPIFQAPSNHLYDTQNYLMIDPYFGTLTTFQTLTSEAESRGIKVILDGVFNHVSSDSTYFDRYSRWNGSGVLTSPSGPGVNDQSGACESTSSTWRSWFTFVAGPPNKCYDGAPGSLTMSYWDWAGYDSLPKLNSALAAVRSYIYSGGTGSVARYWLQSAQGADGWRFDVGGDVDVGTATGDSNGYWAGYRTAAQTEVAGAALLGEEWGDASSWLVGDQWDSVMNYRFRSAVLNWMFDGCSGNGCTGGTKFVENDSNDASSSGPIQGISVSQFDERLRSIQEDYPSEAWYAMMNLLDSHDTNRILFLLKKISGDSASAAMNKFKFVGLFQFTYPGAPTIYYGNEAGLAPDGVWDSTWWQDDPYNRAPFPWSDQGRTPDASLQAYFQKLATLRDNNPVLRTGAFTSLLTDNANKVYAYSRTTGATDLAVVALNRDSSSSHTVTVSGLNPAFNGTTLYDVMNCTGSPVVCASYTVSGGGIANISVSALNGAVLVKGSLAPYIISLAPAQANISAGGSTTLNATVTDIGGQLAASRTVNFTLLSGTGSLTSASATTNSSGVASVTLNDTGATRDVLSVQASVAQPSGSSVTDSTTVFVDYTANASPSSTTETGIGPQTISLNSAITVTKSGLGEPVITLAQFDANPINGSPAANKTGYVDVFLSSDTDVSQLKITLKCTTTCTASDYLWWWDESAGMWKQVTGTTGYTSSEIWFIATSGSSPTLAQLNGTPMGGGPDAPTAITLLGFSSSPQPGYVLVQWQTALEINTLGFRIYRSTSPDGPRTLLTSSPIPSKGLGEGADYTFIDSDVEAGMIYYYWLEEITLDGWTTLYGPANVTLGYPLFLPLLRR